MIPLALNATSDAHSPFVARLGSSHASREIDYQLVSIDDRSGLWSGAEGLVEIDHMGQNLVGDVLLIDPTEGRAERLIRKDSNHNTLLVTEQCDQLCLMCSQPPKKTHHDRFDYFRSACLLAPKGMTIGISGGEPTLHLARLLEMVEGVLNQRPDLRFHVLSNGQHFEPDHISRLRSSVYRNLTWGIPIYSSQPSRHDEIVVKPGAFERLVKSLEVLLLSGARIELRTVLTQRNLADLDKLAHFISANLPFVEQWSIMGLENIGFARRRFEELYVDLPKNFGEVACALDRAILYGIPVRLFNLPHCHVPSAYRWLAVASISDWKRRFADSCSKCRERSCCSGFFEWHPDQLVEEVTPL